MCLVSVLFFSLHIYTSLCCCKLCFWYFDDWQCACVMSGLLFGISFPLAPYGSNHGKVLTENGNLEGKKENLFFNNINDKPLKKLPFIRTPLSAWGHWEQGNHGSPRSSSDLRKPTQLSHRPGNYSLGKISWRSVQQERAGCSALWNLPPTWSVLCWGWWGGQAVGLTHWPTRAQELMVDPTLKAVSSHGQGPALFCVCSAFSTVGISRCYCNTTNKQYSYSKKSVSSILRQFVKNHLTLDFK